ncbi:hypothetical protein [Streptomyces sp. MNP-20]|uniref:hypothetical protein n=1 Tax=Streptomyces sp. MNP-20 TaxID=2721165 RepID=UPI001551E4C0|nr:hypothetical protein [Streptomyces sp. MNP-20]
MAETPNATDPEGTEHVPTPGGQDNVQGDQESSRVQEGQDSGGRADADGQELDDPVKLREELKAAREQAARYRVKARETADALSKAKTPEEFQAVADKAAELELELSRERLARTYNLPVILAGRISGADDDAREADAKALAEAYHGKAAGVGKGGLDPSSKPAPTDPAELAGLVPRARR